MTKVWVLTVLMFAALGAKPEVPRIERGLLLIETDEYGMVTKTKCGLGDGTVLLAETLLEFGDDLHLGAAQNVGVEPAVFLDRWGELHEVPPGYSISIEPVGESVIIGISDEWADEESWRPPVDDGELYTPGCMDACSCQGDENHDCSCDAYKDGERDCCRCKRVQKGTGMYACTCHAAQPQ